MCVNVCACVCQRERERERERENDRESERGLAVAGIVFLALLWGGYG